MTERQNGRKFPELSYKTAWRLFAIYETLIASAIGAGTIFKLKSDSTAQVVLASLAVCITSYIAADGITDLVKGTHHYLGAKTERMFRGKKGKEEIDGELRNQMNVRDKKPSDFKPKKD